MSEAVATITPIGRPEQAGASRGKRSIIRLIVISDDQRSATAALTAFQTDQAVARPNYYLDQAGAIAQLVVDSRAGTSLGRVLYRGRYHNLDRIAISIQLEHRAGTDYSDAQLLTLHHLITLLRERHQLSEATLTTLIDDPAGRRSAIPYLPPPPPLIDSSPLLGGGLNPDQELFVALYAETYRALGGVLKLNQAFPIHAAHFNLGAPIGRNAPPPVMVDGRPFNIQPFARDTIFNEGTDYAAVQELRSLLDHDRIGIPLSDPGRSLLDATYRIALQGVRAAGVTLQGRESLEPGWRFHQVAHNAGFGPPLSGNYREASQRYALQVFAGETLYTPVTDLRGCYRLSATDPTDPAYDLIWHETYKVARAPYLPSEELHQRAVELRLGAPLSAPYSVTIAGSSYRVQIWALDTLYQGSDGTIRRMSELPKPPAIVAWQPKAPRSLPTTPPNPLPPQLPPESTAVPRPGDPTWPPRPTFDILSSSALERTFGTIQWVRIQGDAIAITNDWATNNLVSVHIPQLLKIPGVRSDLIQLHTLVAEQVRQLFAAWERAGLLPLIKSFDGAWIPRTMRLQPTRLSNHAYGIAFDLNARWNPMMGSAALVGQPGSLRELVPLANAHGFYWGGHWNFDGKGASDGMHFEWARPMG